MPLLLRQPQCPSEWNSSACQHRESEIPISVCHGGGTINLLSWEKLKWFPFGNVGHFVACALSFMFPCEITSTERRMDRNNENQNVLNVSGVRLSSVSLLNSLMEPSCMNFVVKSQKPWKGANS